MARNDCPANSGRQTSAPKQMRSVGGLTDVQLRRKRKRWPESSRTAASSRHLRELPTVTVTRPFEGYVSSVLDANFCYADERLQMSDRFFPSLFKAVTVRLSVLVAHDIL